MIRKGVCKCKHPAYERTVAQHISTREGPLLSTSVDISSRAVGSRKMSQPTLTARQECANAIFWTDLVSDARAAAHRQSLLELSGLPRQLRLGCTSVSSRPALAAILLHFVQSAPETDAQRIDFRSGRTACAQRPPPCVKLRRATPSGKTEAQRNDEAHCRGSYNRSMATMTVSDDRLQRAFVVLPVPSTVTLIKHGVHFRLHRLQERESLHLDGAAEITACATRALPHVVFDWSPKQHKVSLADTHLAAGWLAADHFTRDFPPSASSLLLTPPGLCGNVRDALCTLLLRPRGTPAAQ